MLKEINIIFDGPPAATSGRFVEVEDENGKGIGVGKWERSYSHGYNSWKLVLTPADFYTAAELELSKRMLKKVDDKNKE